ncbi:hypothetical protein [Pandoraea pulmonicola]|uniref:Uncharacterized protein n=1 Tax=Pandoraea pulmonicola TaxID=93221 RepID=A0AAJ4ZGV5_PANPU|nr:hypothetical protein [Pandoraea pulmonicola]AJC22614.1 hypothetical protein RO07_22940 [Pandoraea pulmonicola]SUA93178.1 Uncharacterised protein [Pandoraea pulmonicola]
MFIVILGWLYVIAMVAITAPSVWLGLAIFAGGGVAPALLWLYIAGSRIRRTHALRRDDAVPAAPGAPPDSPAHASPPSSPE